MHIVFITQDGYNKPTARIRGYQFAKYLKDKYNADTEVFSFEDDLQPSAHIYKLSQFEKLVLLYKGIKRLKKYKERKKIVFYVQKLNYHTLAAYFTAKRYGFSIIIDMDDWDFDRHAFNWVSVRYLMDMVLSNVDRCVCASRRLTSEIEKYDVPVDYIPTVVDEKKFYSKSFTAQHSSVTVFSWSGRVICSYIFENLKFIIECFSYVYTKNKNVVLEICGDGILMEQVESFVSKYYEKLPVKFLGMISPNGMPEYLDRVDIGLMPMIQENLFMESKSPTKMFEYMAKGISVCASKFGEPLYIIENEKDGFLCANKDEFSNKMLLLSRDAKLRQRIGEWARKKIESRYCMSSVGHELHNILTMV